ncbi:MAG: ribonuclease HI [Planctomycetales bacterium]|nr:ribonuclease HI [Planctomycetales bacterium]
MPAPRERVVAYTDGACRGNPGPGGWGVLLRDGTREKELSGSDPATTNNRMELLAVIRALESLPAPSDVRLHSDSRYVIDGMTRWLSGWRAKGWKTADKKPVKNRDLWELLAAAAARHAVTWIWVEGHAGDPGNERADALANAAIDARP